MTTYLVGTHEVYVVYMEVEADSADEALAAVLQGEGTEESREFSHTMDSDVWTVGAVPDSG
jgi:hypothetical protein